MGNILFVYGTLRPGVKNSRADLFQHTAQHLGQGRVRGSLYNLGAYPGLRRSRHDDAHHPGWVIGALYQLHDPEPTLRTLDLYEGATAQRNDDYERVLLDITSETRVVPAWTYLYRGPLHAATLIPSGDWADVQDEPEPPGVR